MSACPKCRDGVVEIAVRDRIGRDTGDSREVPCSKCNGSGRAACPGCGETSRESDAYCSAKCRREDEGVNFESRRDAARDDRAAGLID